MKKNAREGTVEGSATGFKNAFYGNWIKGKPVGLYQHQRLLKVLCAACSARPCRRGISSLWEALVAFALQKSSVDLRDLDGMPVRDLSETEVMAKVLVADDDLAAGVAIENGWTANGEAIAKHSHTVIEKQRCRSLEPDEVHDAARWVWVRAGRLARADMGIPPEDAIAAYQIYQAGPDEAAACWCRALKRNVYTVVGVPRKNSRELINVSVTFPLNDAAYDRLRTGQVHPYKLDDDAITPDASDRLWLDALSLRPLDMGGNGRDWWMLEQAAMMLQISKLSVLGRPERLPRSVKFLAPGVLKAYQRRLRALGFRDTGSFFLDNPEAPMLELELRPPRPSAVSMFRGWLIQLAFMWSNMSVGGSTK